MWLNAPPPSPLGRDPSEAHAPCSLPWSPAAQTQLLLGASFRAPSFLVSRPHPHRGFLGSRLGQLKSSSWGSVFWRPQNMTASLLLSPETILQLARGGSAVPGLFQGGFMGRGRPEIGLTPPSPHTPSTSGLPSSAWLAVTFSHVLARQLGGVGSVSVGWW